jgi:hypothetical protein
LHQRQRPERGAGSKGNRQVVIEAHGNGFDESRDDRGGKRRGHDED